MKTRIFTLLVAFLTMVGNAVWGQEHTFPGGDGSKDNPYQISTADDLKAFRDLVNGGDADACAKLTADIDLKNEEWEPIMYMNTSTYEMGYSGTFDGNNKTIKGLSITGKNKNSSVLFNGLFGFVGIANITSGTISDKNGVVKNLTIEGRIETAETLNESAGGICYQNYGTIESCINKISISSATTQENPLITPYIGGICSKNYGTIRNCSNEEELFSLLVAGGICASNAGTIEKCYNIKTITGASYASGICAAAHAETSSVENCYNAGEIKSDNNAAGICCKDQSASSSATTIHIKNCHNYGAIEDSKHSAGIFLMYKSATNYTTTEITNCYYKKDENVTIGFLYTTNNSSEPDTPNDQPGQVEAKSEDAFANGEVLALLQNNNPGVWTQGDEYPIFLKEDETPTTVYTITFDYNYEGSEPEYQYALEGSSATVEFPADPTREGYTFLGWSESEEGEVISSTENVAITSDKTYYAQWQEEQTEEPEQPGGEGDDEQGGIVPDAPKYYNIYEDEICEGIEVEFSRDVVKEGQSVLVTITVDEEFDATKMTLKFKRSLFGYWVDLTLTPTENPNEYIIENIYTDIYVRAEGAVPTGIEDINGAKVYTKDGSIYVQTPKQEQVTIISASGAVLKNEQQVGLKQYTGLQRGIYIICIDEARFKVRL